MRRFDYHFLEFVQDAYLWFYDRTGVYVASTSMALVILTTVSNPITPWILCSLSIIGALIIVRYHEQDRGPEKFNSSSRYWRYSALRMAVIVVAVITTLIDVFAADWWRAISAMIDGLNFGYVWAVQIRKREPPEVHSLARQGVR